MKKDLNVWLDRVQVKTKINDWLNSESNDFLLITDDSTETEDITNWFENENKDYLTGTSIIHPEDDTPEFKLMENLIHEFPKFDFSRFVREKEDILKEQNKVTVKQEIGKDIEADGNIGFYGNHQELSLNLPSKLYKLNAEKNSLLNAFIHDILKLSKQHKILILCRFISTNDFNPNFMHWIQNFFLRRLKRIGNIKICIISSNENTYLHSYYKEKLLALKKHEIIPVAEKHLDFYQSFCDTIVDLDNESINYEIFKYKLIRAVKNKECQNHLQ